VQNEFVAEKNKSLVKFFIAFNWNVSILRLFNPVGAGVEFPERGPNVPRLGFRPDRAGFLKSGKFNRIRVQS